MGELNDIAKKNGTDKSSLIHDYCVKYEKYLPFKRDDKLKILEIGVLNGSSVKTWKEYFFNSEIVGLDINLKCKQYEEDRITIEIGSQFDSEFLKYVAEKHGPFDMILDDGSHINEHVIFSFNNLFKYVKSKGLYVVEDACTSYWNDYGGSAKGPHTMISYFKERIDEVNFGGEWVEGGDNIHARKDDVLLNQFKRKGYDFIGTQMESINFLNSIILITKR